MMQGYGQPPRPRPPPSFQHEDLPAAQPPPHRRADPGRTPQPRGPRGAGEEPRRRTFTLARDPQAGRHDVLPRLAENLRVLRAAYRSLADDVRRGAPSPPRPSGSSTTSTSSSRRPAPSATTCPCPYYEKLPKLAARELSGKARLYAMALALIRHGDGRLDAERLTRFVLAYQTVAPLTIGELWAWPSMLKLALLENLRRILPRRSSTGSVARRAGRRARSSGSRPEALPPLPPLPLHSAFVDAAPPADARVRPARLVAARRGGARARRERDDAPRTPSAPSTSGRRPTRPRRATRSRACELCVDARLEPLRGAGQPGGADPPARPGGASTRGWTFQSRDRYRQAVEKLAEPTGEAQVRVALRAVESARQAAEQKGNDDRAAHVGYHLIGPGRAGLEIDVAFHPRPARAAPPFRLPPRDRPPSSRRNRPPDGARRRGGDRVRPRPGTRPTWRSPRRFSRSSRRASSPSSIVQRLVAALVPPRRLPRLDFSSGVPESARTMVVVPTLLGSVAGVERLLAHLEVQALGNLDPHIHFAILSDFKDAPAAEMEGDAAILAAARSGIEALNRRYPAARGPLLPLPPRPEVEPKEGGLHGVGAQAREARGVQPAPAGREPTRSFPVQVGNVSILPSVTLRPDARHRHAPPAQRGADAHRHPRAPAEPAGLRPRPSDA